MNQIISSTPAFLRRVLAHDAAQKGLLSAAAGLLVAAVCESVWPSAR
jgi:hypothetical protein